MTWSEVTLLVAGAFLVLLWFVWVVASRLDRLHRKVATSRAALENQLVRRASTAAELAASGLLDPVSSILVGEAAWAALSAGGHGRAELVAALPDLGRMLRHPSDEMGPDADPTVRPDDRDLAEIRQGGDELRSPVATRRERRPGGLADQDGAHRVQQAGRRQLRGGRGPAHQLVLQCGPGGGDLAVQPVQPARDHPDEPQQHQKGARDQQGDLRPRHRCPLASHRKLRTEAGSSATRTPGVEPDRTIS